jgi:CBS domain-containing protein
MSTKVQELMTANPVMIAPENTLAEAAERMKAVGCGVLPVGTPDMPLGVITDRDVVIRAVAEGKDPREEKVADHMTPELVCCRLDETVEQAAARMGENGVSRLAVKDGDGKICGLLTFGAIVRKNQSAAEIGRAIERAVGGKAA